MSRKKENAYSEIDDFCIINFYNKIDIEILVNALNRTKGSIRFRAVQLGVSAPLIRLTNAQKKFIDENENKLGPKAIATAIGASRDAVARRIWDKKNKNK